MLNLKDITRCSTVDHRVQKCPLCKGGGKSTSADDANRLERLSQTLIVDFKCDHASVVCFASLYAASQFRRMQALQIFHDLLKRKQSGDASRGQRLKGNT